MSAAFAWTCPDCHARNAPNQVVCQECDLEIPAWWNDE